MRDVARAFEALMWGPVARISRNRKAAGKVRRRGCLSNWFCPECEPAPDLVRIVALEKRRKACRMEG